jgi:hypothetical protein
MGPRQTFGTFAGCVLRDVPSGYLAWCLANVTRIDRSLRQAIEAELHDRHDREERDARDEWDGRRSSDEAAVVREGVLDRWYREMVLRFHPDRGGSTEAARVINHAHDRLRQMLGLDVAARGVK